MTAQTILTVGRDGQCSTINAAVMAANKMGGNADIQVESGNYNSDGGKILVDNVTVEGVGPVSISAPPASTGSSAGFIIDGHNVLLKNLKIYGAADPEYTAAGVQYNGGSLTLDNVIVSGVQAGLLATADPTGSITVRNSEFRDNGNGTIGLYASIDIGDVGAFTLSNSFLHTPKGAAQLRSRAENNVIVNNVIDDNYTDTSYAIDLPNGGNAIINGNSIQHVAWDGYTAILSYGEAGALYAGRSVQFNDNLVFNGDPSTPELLWSNHGAIITGSGNSVYGVATLGAGVNPASVTVRPSAPNPDDLEIAKMASIEDSMVGTKTLHPTISAVIGVPYTGIRLTGTAEAGTMVAVIDNIHGHATLLGTVIAGSNSVWSFMNASGIGHIDLSAVHQYSVVAWDGAGRSGNTPGALFLADTGKDVLTGTAGAPDIFAIMSNLGSDVINGFEATGAAHDVINFSGRGLTSFTQVEAIMSGSTSTVFTLAGGKTVTLAGVAPSSLAAADFRFS